MKIENVWVDEANIYVVLNSGYTIGNPLSWFKRLHGATPDQRRKYEIGPHGEGIPAGVSLGFHCGHLLQYGSGG